MENPAVGPRAIGFLVLFNLLVDQGCRCCVTGKNKKQAMSVYIVDPAGRSPVAEQAARSQIAFSHRLLEGTLEYISLGQSQLERFMT